MKILHIVPLVSDDSAFGGPVRGTARQCHALTEIGHDCHILALWRGGGDVPSEVLGVSSTLYRFWKLPGHRFATAFHAGPLQWITRRRRKFDAVHVHAGRDLWILVAMLLMRIYGIRYVWQTHGMLAPRSGIAYRIYDKLLTSPALAGAESVLYLTDYEKRDLDTVGRVTGVDHLVNGVEEIADDVTANPVSDSDTIRLVFISRIHPRKRLIDLVHAVEKLTSSGRKISLDIYGPDEGALGEVLADIDVRSLDEIVKYKGALPYSEVRPTLRNYDVMVLPSVDEPFPNIVLESLASGVPVILTNSCGLAPYVRQYDAGVVVEPGVDGVAGGILSVSADPVVRERFRANGLQLAREKFTMSGVAQVLSMIYKGERSDD